MPACRRFTLWDVGKKYKGKPCAYCVEATATTADHVIGRKFFLADRRDKLPIVPACRQCNREKARLEDHLMVVLGFAHSRMDKRMEAQAKMIQAMGLTEKTARGLIQ